MADRRHVLAQRDADRREDDDAARDPAAAELRDHARGADALSAPRIAVPPALKPEAFAGHDPTAAIVTLDGATMGTTWRVRFARPTRVDSEDLRTAIEDRLAHLVRQMSHWEADSVLSRFNRSRAGSWTTLPKDFAHVIAAGLDVARRSSGAFDPAIGALVDLWGYGPVAVTIPPTDALIGAALAQSGWRRLAYEPNSRLLHQPGGVRLDLSGIAKGYAVDAVTDLLGQRGIRHCLIDIGGELVGRGVKPDGDPWWVELETPPGAALSPFRVALHELAVATSGDYVRGRHNLDPGSGRPASTDVASVSVLHDSAMRADAWASALLVLGSARGLMLAQAEGLAARFVFRDSRGFGEALTPALEAMLND